MRFFQKQPCISILSKSCSKMMQEIYRRTPMPKCSFNKVASENMLQSYVRTPKPNSNFNTVAKKLVNFLYICCIFSEYLFLRTPPEGCFYFPIFVVAFFHYVIWTLVILLRSLISFKHFISLLT